MKEQIQFVKVDNLEIGKEELSLEILRTREELQVVTEVREELVKLYAENKEMEQIMNSAVSEKEGFKTEIEKLAAELHDYKVAEKKLEAEVKLQKLEQLSAKFSALGQIKTVEQLQGKDEETLSEFERIVDAALIRVGETTEMPSVTINSQEKLESATSNVDKPSKEVAAKPKEQLSNKEFFANICDKLTSEQLGTIYKRVKTF